MILNARPAGSGQLEVHLSSGQSAAVSVCAHSPLKLLVPRPRGPSVWSYVSTLGGGMLGGDNISLSIDVGARARCFLGTQASTKIFRNPDRPPGSQTLKARLADGAFLAVVPEPVQCFRGSRYRQRQEFGMHPNSGLVLVDWLGSGRVARGERWAFTRYESRNEIWIGQNRVLLDSLLLDPTDGALTGGYRVGRFNCLALVAILGGLVQSFAAHLLEDIAAQPVSGGAHLVVCASPIQGGALLRLAGESVEAVTAQIQRHLDFVSHFLGDNPWRRKF